MDKSTKDWIRTTITAGLGALFGILITNYYTDKQDVEKRRLEFLSHQFRAEEMKDASEEFVSIKQLVETVGDLSQLDGEVIRKLAALNRNYPECLANLSDSCRKYWIKFIQVNRGAFKQDRVSDQDIDALFKPIYDLVKVRLNDSSDIAIQQSDHSGGIAIQK